MEYQEPEDEGVTSAWEAGKQPRKARARSDRGTTTPEPLPPDAGQPVGAPPPPPEPPLPITGPPLRQSAEDAYLTDEWEADKEPG